MPHKIMQEKVNKNQDTSFLSVLIYYLLDCIIAHEALQMCYNVRKKIKSDRIFCRSRVII